MWNANYHEDTKRWSTHDYVVPCFIRITKVNCTL